MGEPGALANRPSRARPLPHSALQRSHQGDQRRDRWLLAAHIAVRRAGRCRDLAPLPEFSKSGALRHQCPRHHDRENLGRHTAPDTFRGLKITRCLVCQGAGLPLDRAAIALTTNVWIENTQALVSGKRRTHCRSDRRYGKPSARTASGSRRARGWNKSGSA